MNTGTIGDYEYRNCTRVGDTVKGEQRWLGGRWMMFSADWRLAKIHFACDDPTAAARIWGQQDGYGEVGVTPEQGWDWSGIRDSSPEALDRMYAIATEFISDAEMEAGYGLAEAVAS
jgi:hypothetical protein